MPPAAFHRAAWNLSNTRSRSPSAGRRRSPPPTPTSSRAAASARAGAPACAAACAARRSRAGCRAPARSAPRRRAPAAGRRAVRRSPGGRARRSLQAAQHRRRRSRASEAQSRSSAIAPLSRRVICSTLATCSDISRDCWKMLCASARALLAAPGARRARPGSTMRPTSPRAACAGRARSRPSSALRMRSVSAWSASSACACALAAHAVGEARDHQADREHDGEGQQVLRIVDRESVPRGRNEEAVERQHAQHRGGDGRPAAEAQRDQRPPRAGTPSRC